jgi:hypothetical protein
MLSDRLIQALSNGTRKYLLDDTNSSSTHSDTMQEMEYASEMLILSLE